VLGADDRAGCWLIYQNAKDINFILCRDEEIGGVGSEMLAENGVFKDLLEDFQIPCGIVLDRRGTCDIIGVHNNYCEADLVRDVQKVLPTYVETFGTFCDADQLNGLLPCVNLSVGYENAHTQGEYLDLIHLFSLSDEIQNLNDELAYNFYDKPMVRNIRWYEDTCDLCGQVGVLYETSVGSFCNACVRDLQDEFADVILDESLTAQWEDEEDDF
jgi:hypothetical protein